MQSSKRTEKKKKTFFNFLRSWSLHNSENARSAKTVKCVVGKKWQWNLHIPSKLTLFKMTTSDAEITVVQSPGNPPEDRYLLQKGVQHGWLRSPHTNHNRSLRRNSHILWLGHKLMTTKPKHKKHKHIFSHTKKKIFLCTFYLFSFYLIYCKDLYTG